MNIPKLAAQSLNSVAWKRKHWFCRQQTQCHCDDPIGWGTGLLDLDVTYSTQNDARGLCFELEKEPRTLKK